MSVSTSMSMSTRIFFSRNMDVGKKEFLKQMSMWETLYVKMACPVLLTGGSATMEGATLQVM